MTLIEKIGVTVFIGFWMIMIFGVIGWGMNVYKLIHLDFKTPYKAEIMRGIGLFPVVGAITGWMEISDN